MKLVCLDLDGTLEDSRDDMVAAVERVRGRLGLAARPDALIRPNVHRGMPHLYSACFDELTDQAAVRDAFEADYGAHIADRTQLYPGIAEALEELAAFATLACVTNKPEVLAKALLTHLGVVPWFAAVIGGDTCAAGKPDPRMLDAAAERAGFDPAAGPCFMVGDTPGDIRLGEAYGATTVWCAWGYADAPGERAPDLVAHKPADLPELLRAAP